MKKVLNNTLYEILNFKHMSPNSLNPNCKVSVNEFVFNFQDIDCSCWKMLKKKAILNWQKKNNGKRVSPYGAT